MSNLCHTINIKEQRWIVRRFGFDRHDPFMLRDLDRFLGDDKAQPLAFQDIWCMNQGIHNHLQGKAAQITRPFVILSLRFA